MTDGDPVFDIPPGWAEVAAGAPAGLILVAGGGSAGKSTFCRYLFGRLAARGIRPAYLDGDPGQTFLGPPGTITVLLGRPGAPQLRGESWRWFVGATTPRGHMLALVTGAARLAERARAAGAEAVIYDTSGLVDPAQGGTTLKLAEMDLLRPAAVIAIQRDRELEAWLAPLRLSGRTRVADLQQAPAARSRSLSRRQNHRAAQYARHFAGAHALTVDWSRIPVWPAPRFYPGRLLACEDVEGFALGLGIVLEVEMAARRVVIHTPLESQAGVDALRLGDLLVDPESYHDRPLGPALTARQGSSGG